MIIHKGKGRVESLYAASFDEEGYLDTPKFESLVAGLMARVMDIQADKTTL